MRNLEACRGGRRRAASAAAVMLAVACAVDPSGAAAAEAGKVRVGLMLPYTGTYAALGHAITNGFKLAVSERGEKLGGRGVEYFTVDDESDPAKAPENATKLVKRDRVDVLVGTVHSGVALGMAKVARETNTLMVDPNAGADELTGALCAPNIFRTSFSNWQPAFPMGKVAADMGHKTAVTFTWKYPAGDESVGGFKDGFTKAGGKVLKDLTVPFPNVEFQALLTELASLKPDCVYAFFAGGGALKFIKDYAAAGLNTRVKLYGPGFLTDGVYREAGAAAEGLKTTLHYADDLDTPLNKKFRADFKQRTGREADVYAVQGYDTGTFLLQGLDAVKGDVGADKALVKAWEGLTIDSPRGVFKLSPSHDPIQDIYLRQVTGGQEKLLGVAHKALADPGTGCKMT